MKNGKRSHRWRLWHARRKYYKSQAHVLDLINTVTIQHLRHSPNCLHDVIFTDSPLVRLLKINTDVYVQDGVMYMEPLEEIV